MAHDDPSIAYATKMQSMREAVSKLEEAATIAVDPSDNAGKFFAQILQAQRLQFDRRMVQFLSHLCFPLPYTRDANGLWYVLWRPVLQMLDQSFDIKADSWMCNGEVGLVYLPNHIQGLVELLCPYVERARRNNPYHNADSSAQVSATALLDTIDDLQTSNPTAANQIDNMRRCYINYLRSHFGRTKGYSAFISHASQDMEFAEKLYSDLTNNGIYCWFAPKDLHVGDKFRSRINDSINNCDRFIAIISANSIQSIWVEEEVEAALECERIKGGQVILLPIRLDDSVMQTARAWAANLRRTRHIGNFVDWRDPETYKTALGRLLGDLRVDF